ncbi:DUF2309 domain-containing protein [Gaetbulibacter aestuarii]|uniref:Probable inorganic carbon transporter subunit DabA n=1 Tax=Gaetbulibacter aestuarii TaxID=1502358 RepID=A0ABW7MU37_9FLAO
MTQEQIKNKIEKASKVIGKTWPLYSFVTSNPLSGYENLSFDEAISQARKYLSATVYPSASVFDDALKQGEIHNEILIDLLKKQNFTESPEFYLQQMTVEEQENNGLTVKPNHDLDRIISKWLATFMDEGLADWTMPFKEEGFYRSWRELAIYDSELPKLKLKDIPESADAALELILKDIDSKDIDTLFTYHLAALPGWTGYINYRTQSESIWQEKYPISLQEYLAVRLFVAHVIHAELLPENIEDLSESSQLQIPGIFLEAWEKSWQNSLVKTLSRSAEVEPDDHEKVPDAQMVFCIDTRSELIRRHIETKGHYETHGYAGFFGIAMDYEHLDDGVTYKSCPPIVTSAYKVKEQGKPEQVGALENYKLKVKQNDFKYYFLKRMKSMLPSAFGFVEASGFFYGFSLLMRTLASRVSNPLEKHENTGFEPICSPEMSACSGHDEVSVNEKASIVKSAFDLMGWNHFARLVLFIGHGSQTANNPFGSSLDCGACAASPGRHNARLLAKLANMPEVRNVLNKEYHYDIPEDTVFIGGEHNTTTDAILLFDEDVPASHHEALKILKTDLEKAQQTATTERLGASKNSVAMAETKANNWGETRPEWGLAKNAGFIIGPRSLTKYNNLDGRCFLHSYQWNKDKEGKALEGIMQGPMVVTQWINNHYYFSSVDNEVFGGGSKITHNITGKFGVVQGNGGDLKLGLPLQSLKQTDTSFYHKPLRLSVVIQAPLKRVTDILSRNESLKNLLDNKWIYLMVMDPEEENEMYKYDTNLNWLSANATSERIKTKKEVETSTSPEVYV